MKQVFFVPDRGDVIWITPSSSDGEGKAPHQGPRSGRRCAAVVLSPQSYNRRVGLALFCPVVTEIKGYPFEVPLPAGLPVRGAILADQIASVDWRAGRAERICSISPAVLGEAVGKLRTLLG
jgi:mRNA interferase MazF